MSLDDIIKTNLKYESEKVFHIWDHSVNNCCTFDSLQYLTNAINHTLQTNCFPDKLKQSKVIPVNRKLDPLEKENHRPASLLSDVSKVFERIKSKQINILKIKYQIM